MSNQHLHIQYFQPHRNKHAYQALLIAPTCVRSESSEQHGGRKWNAQSRRQFDEYTVVRQCPISLVGLDNMTSLLQTFLQGLMKKLLCNPGAHGGQLDTQFQQCIKRCTRNISLVIKEVIPDNLQQRWNDTNIGKVL